MSGLDPIGFDPVDPRPVDAHIVPAHVTAVLRVVPELGAAVPRPEPITQLEVTGSPALIARVVGAAVDAVEDEPLR